MDEPSRRDKTRQEEKLSSQHEKDEAFSYGLKLADRVGMIELCHVLTHMSGFSSVLFLTTVHNRSNELSLY